MDEFMMEFLPDIVLFVIAIVWVCIANSQKKANAETLPQSPVEDTFPQIEILEPVVQPEKSAMKRPKNAINRHKVPSVPKSVKAEEPARQKQRQRISMKTKSDAKRAFLYSEIFNRKY